MYLLQVCLVCFHICSPNIFNKVKSLVLQDFHWCPPVWTTHVLHSICAGRRTVHILILYHTNIFLEVM